MEYLFADVEMPGTLASTYGRVSDVVASVVPGDLRRR
jgi:hypothetical protein